MQNMCSNFVAGPYHSFSWTCGQCSWLLEACWMKPFKFPMCSRSPNQLMGTPSRGADRSQRFRTLPWLGAPVGWLGLAAAGERGGWRLHMLSWSSALIRWLGLPATGVHWSQVCYLPIKGEPVIAILGSPCTNGMARISSDVQSQKPTSNVVW